MSSPTLDIAHFIGRITFDTLPENLRSTINKFLLDAVGCGVYGGTTRSGRILAEHVMDKGGREEASLWGRGWRGPAESGGQFVRDPIAASPQRDCSAPSNPAL